MTAPTGKQLCLAAQQRLENAGIADAGRDATALFLHVLRQELGDGVQRHHLASHLSEPAPLAVADGFERAVAARESRQPVSQIIGRRDFWNHSFRVTRDTLDPRPDTETLVEAVLEARFRRVLDLGTGTGAILISLLAERPEAEGVGTDISSAALKVAQQNADRIGVRARFLLSDWFAQVEGAFDLIVSNPPYIALSEMDALDPEVRLWEPHQALTDGGDGLAAYRAIASGARAHLTPGGRLAVEIGPGQAADVSAIFRDAGFPHVNLRRDLDGRDRVILASDHQNPAGFR